MGGPTDLGFLHREKSAVYRFKGQLPPRLTSSMNMLHFSIDIFEGGGELMRAPLYFNSADLAPARRGQAIPAVRGVQT